MRHDNNASNGSSNNNDGNDEDYKANDDTRAAGAPISIIALQAAPLTIVQSEIFAKFAPDS